MSRSSSNPHEQENLKAYPSGFLAQYDVIECLSFSPFSETLLVVKRGKNEYRIAKVTSGTEFDSEYTLLSTLSHPQLPTIYESFSDGDTHVMIRSFIEGKPLHMITAERPLSESEIIRIAMQLCDVLAYLHEQNPPVIHRDIKPQNIILDSKGKITLIDFGIARTYKSGASRDTVFSGTIDFAPPEQYGFLQTSARADLYSLGMTMKFLLTNGAQEAEITNPELRRIIQKCTAFSPSKRYASARALKRALKHADGKRAWQFTAVAAALAALVCGVLLGRYAMPYDPASIAFAEPVVEKAIRLELGKPEGILTTQDMARVLSLRIVHNDAFATIEEEGNAYNTWRASPQLYKGSGISTLEDLAMLPNLQVLMISSGNYRDVDALAACKSLKFVQLTDNTQLIDIRGFSALENLEYLGLVGCKSIADISPLINLSKLSTLDLTGCDTLYNPAPLENMGDFDGLYINANPMAYLYVHDKRILNLRLAATGLDSMKSLDTVTGLRSLDINNTPLTCLNGIELHTELESLNISGTKVTDLSPLLLLPKLKELVLSTDMTVDLTELKDIKELTIHYS